MVIIIAFQAGRDKMLKHYSKTNWTYCSSLILDPRHKIASFDITSWGREMKTGAIKAFKEMYETYYQEMEKNQESTINNVTSDIDNDLNLDFIYAERTHNTASEEFDAYINAPRASKDCDVLNWWKIHETMYPILAWFAKDILEITATPVPAERLFSKASLVIKKHRNRLNAQSAIGLFYV